MTNIFTEKNNVYDLRNKRQFKTENVRTVRTKWNRNSILHKHGKLYLTANSLIRV